MADVFANVFGSNFVIDNVHIDEPFPSEKYSREKFTFQISDHLLIWIGIKTDIEGLRLNQIGHRGRNKSAHRERLTNVKCLDATPFSSL